MRERLKMFLTFFKIGMFTLGGGYAMISLFEEEVVRKKKWIESEEFLDIIALAQSLPGALAVNSATYIGYRIFGFTGAVLGCLGILLPSFISILFVAMVFHQFQSEELVVKAFSGIRPAVVALILSSVVKLSANFSKTFFNLTLASLSVLAVALFDIHPIFVIIAAAIAGYFFFKGERSNGSAR